MLVTKSANWLLLCVIGVFFNVTNRSPTSQSCHQHISPTHASIIRHQHRCSLHEPFLWQWKAYQIKCWMEDLIAFLPRNKQHLNTICFYILLSLHLYQLEIALESASKTKIIKTTLIRIWMKHSGQFSMRHYQFASTDHRRVNPRKYGQQSVGEKA